MDVRRLTVDDCPVVRRRAGELAAEHYPELIEDVDRTHAMLAELRQDSKHYARVIGEPGAPVAVLIAQVGDNLWATRRHAAIILWYSDKPGAGAVLLRDFKRWVLEQKQIAVAGLTDDCGLKDNVLRLLERVGFKQRGRGAWALFPRGTRK